MTIPRGEHWVKDQLTSLCEILRKSNILYGNLQFLYSNHILIELPYIYPYRKVCNYFLIALLWDQ